MSKIKDAQGLMAVTPWTPITDKEDPVYLIRTFTGPYVDGDGDVHPESIVPKIVVACASAIRIIVWFETYDPHSNSFCQIDDTTTCAYEGDNSPESIAEALNAAIEPFVSMAYEDSITAQDIEAALRVSGMPFDGTRDEEDEGNDDDTEEAPIEVDECQCDDCVAERRRARGR